MTYEIFGADQDSLMEKRTNRKEAFRVARKILGVSRLVFGRDQLGQFNGWLHASKVEGCASVYCPQIKA